jgi:hypothetical protein
MSAAKIVNKPIMPITIFKSTLHEFEVNLIDNDNTNINLYSQEYKSKSK